MRMKCPKCGLLTTDVATINYKEKGKKPQSYFSCYGCDYLIPLDFPDGFPHYLDERYWGYADNGTLTEFDHRNFLFDIYIYFQTLDISTREVSE